MNPLGLEASLIAFLLLNPTSTIDLIKWTQDLIGLSIAWITWNMTSINYVPIITSDAHGLLFLFPLLEILMMAIMLNLLFPFGLSLVF